MATNTGSVRRGLPRWHGGEPWPPAADVPDHLALTHQETGDSAPELPETVDPSVPPAPSGPTQAVPLSAAAAPEGMRVRRRGLPRTPGTEPWPPVGEPAPHGVMSAAPATASVAAPADSGAPATPVTRAAHTVTVPTASESDRPLRRGLPRIKGGERWPLAGFAPVVDTPEPAAAVTASQTPVVAPAEPTPELVPSVPPAAQLRPTAPVPPPSSRRPASAATPKRRQIKGLSLPKALRVAVLGGLALLLAALLVVVTATWLVNLPAMRDFMTTYPGEYHLPEGVVAGFPAWVQWQHFFNAFLIVLIIRSGLQVRTEQKPSAYWTPRWSKNGQGKISLALWFHQSLDILWLLNGILFVVMLFVTGHWMRIVPTSWEVFPNALSAALQYLSLNWPTENGWVNYNSLQQLMYFITVFIAAPLAALTGVRMSGVWPKNAKTLSKLYPVELARAIHFPVMLFFSAFILVHVALVFATGALRNLNHMYAGRDVVNWTGFWIFFASLVVIIGGWIAARPFVLAQIAKLSGKVTAR